MRITGSVRAVLILAAIAGLLLVVRLCPLLRRPGVAWAMRNDSIAYIRLAKGLATGCGFALRFGESCGPAELLRTPGYPVFLAAMPSLRTALVVQDVLGTGVCFLIGLFAWRRRGLLAGVLAESLLGFDIPSIVNSNVVLTDTLFTFVITVAILLQLVAICKGTLEGRTVAAILGAGLLLGMAALVRPIGQVLIIEAPIPFIQFHRVSLRKRVVLMLLVLCLPSVVLIGWSYRNYERRGIWTFCTVPAIGIYAYQGAWVVAHETGRSFDDVQAELIRTMPRLGNSKSGDMLSDRLVADSAYLNQSEDLWSRTYDADPVEMKKRGARIVLEHPWLLAVADFKGLLRTCFWVQRYALSYFFVSPRLDLGREEAGLGIRRQLLSALSYPWLSFLLIAELAMLTSIWLGVIMTLALNYRRLFRPIGPIVIPLCVAILLLAASAGPLSEDRYRVPAMPMLAMIAAFGWDACVRVPTRDAQGDKAGEN
jgi:4-amino-4-deoxy-L-arabinose transferase-like glycosyltransferase